MSYTEETLSDNPTFFNADGKEQPGELWVNMRKFREMTGQFLETAKKFYSLSKNPPGEVMLSVGMKNALNVLMYDSDSAQKTDALFPDPEYRIDLVIQSQSLGFRMPEIEELYNDIIFAFNANALQR